MAKDLLEFPTRSRIRALIESGNYIEVDQVLVFIQKGFEQGGISDSDLSKAFKVFDSYIPRFSETLENWVDAMPSSYPARLARAKYLVSKAGFHRGYSRSRDVKQEDWDIVRACYERASEDLYRSLELTSTPILSYVTLMHMNIIAGGDFEGNYQQAIRIFPASMEARRMKMWHLRQEWGGSLESLKEYVDSDEHKIVTPEYRQRMQATYYEARGHWFEHFENDSSQAEKEYRKSVDIQPLSFNLAKLGGILVDKDQKTEGIGYLKRAMELEPDNNMVKAEYAYGLIRENWFNKPQADILLKEAADWGEWYAVQVLEQTGRQSKSPFIRALNFLVNTQGFFKVVGSLVLRIIFIAIAVWLFNLFTHKS